MSRDVEVLRALQRREREQWAKIAHLCEPRDGMGADVDSALSAAISALETRESDSLALASCRARLAEAEKALRPFAALAEHHRQAGYAASRRSDVRDVLHGFHLVPGESPAELRLSDCIAAAVALESSPPSTTRPPDTEHHDADEGRDDAVSEETP